MSIRGTNTAGVRIDQMQGLTDADWRDLQALQQRLVLRSGIAPSSLGFLVTTFEREELEALLRDGARCYTAQREQRLVAYAIFAPAHYLTDFFHAPGGRFCLDTPPSSALAHHEFVYQLAVDPDLARCGVATGLLSEHLGHTDHGLIVDVVSEPYCNDASLRFFHRHGFRRIGTLHFGSYGEVGPMVTQVLVKPSEGRLSPPPSRPPSRSDLPGA